MRQHLRCGGRVDLVAAVAGVVLAASGTGAITLALVDPAHAPQPPPSAAGALEPFTTSDTTPLAHRSPAAPPQVDPVLAPSAPVAVDIPAIGVHSPLQHLGLTDRNTVEVPAPGPHYDEAAWYRYSSTPGALGPAVILGHVDSAATGPSVFFHLGDLRPGDEVLVTREDGVVAVFSVDAVRRYPKDRFPTQLVYGDTDRAALRLITCGGTFDDTTGHYLDNIVAYASLTSSQ